MKEKVYIYTLNDKNGVPFYIGKTNNITYREYQHIWEAKQGFKYRKACWLRSHNYEFNIEVLDEVLKIDWQFWESFWISQFKSWGFTLVNHTDGGEGFNGSHTEETKKKMSETKKGKKPKNLNSLIELQKNNGKKVYQYNTFGRLISEYTSISEASKISGVDNISRSIKYNKISGGYFWSFDKDYTPNYNYVINNKPKKVRQIDINGNVVKIWDSVCDIKKNFTTINRVLNGKLKTAGGFKWEYV